MSLPSSLREFRKSSEILVCDADRGGRIKRLSSLLPGSYCFKYALDGGTANVLAGSSLGRGFLVKNGWDKRSSKDGRALGSFIRISVIMSLASLEIGTWSGNE